MSGTLPANEPRPVDEPASSAIELLIEARPRDLGGFSVRRLLPSPKRRLVGPFVFFDHMGPAALPPGQGFDVRPHPHIALATVTYLFEGAIVHRDSLGTLQTIEPGDVNWMVAGSGIVHSERSSESARREGIRIHGIQSWVALPLEHEESAPSFEHHPHRTLPRIEQEGVRLDVIAGSAFGARSPASVLSPTLYVHGTLEAGARLTLDGEHEERALYVVSGAVRCAGEPVAAGALAILRPQREVTLSADTASRIMLLGGAPLAGERHIEWNFVSSSRARLERAKDDWRAGRFPKIEGDDEFIPLPEAESPRT